jgi:hypothetical protein
MKIKGYLFAAAAVAILAAHLAAPSKAQTANSGAGAFSGSNANSGSASTSGAITGPSTSGAAAGASTGATSAGVTFQTGNNSPYTVNNPASTTATIIAAPPVYIAPIATGNACALGASAGASWLGAGFAVGTTWESVQCENRHRVALLFNMGEKVAAKEVLCDTREVYEGFKRAGTPCTPRPDWEPKGTSPAPVQPIAAPAPSPPRMAFNAAAFPSASECLTAASAAGAPLSSCAGKR